MSTKSTFMVSVCGSYVCMCVCEFKHVSECVHASWLALMENWSVVHEFFMYCIKVHNVGTSFIVSSLHLH